MNISIEAAGNICTIEMIMLAIYNKPRKFLLSVFDANHLDTYLDEQQSRMMNNFGAWWSGLDVSHRVRAVEAAERFYGNEARDRVVNY